MTRNERPKNLFTIFANSNIGFGLWEVRFVFPREREREENWIMWRLRILNPGYRYRYRYRVYVCMCLKSDFENISFLFSRLFFLFHVVFYLFFFSGEDYVERQIRRFCLDWLRWKWLVLGALAAVCDWYHLECQILRNSDCMSP